MNIRLLKKWSEDLAGQFSRRLTGKEKERFLDKIEEELQECNSESERIKIKHWGFTNRLLFTKCEKPEVVFLAHYDTPTIMPWGISSAFTLFGHTRQVLASIFLIILTLTLSAIYHWLEFNGFGYWATIYLMITSILLVIPIFFPNPNNAEDNTSGVIGLLALAEQIKDESFKEKVQFVFLDNEEWGLIGSNALKRIWQKDNHLRANTAIINLDCVSRGEVPLLVYHHNNRVAQEVLPFLQEHLPQTQMLDMKRVPLSDNYTFREKGAIDISYADKTIIPGGFYIPKIHTPSDKDFSPAKTAQLINALTEFLEEKFTDTIA
ncbi:MAG: M28 family peptidase [Anaerolineales bacterium]|uniref:M28 family peptidase n=1 Tax=Candidatus Desulfolinea nitratireducens TaxID=2841698 RepID=A0A8J6NHW4_9CHLR|nr:M28 family peptidase [Candidatus Desulfolinea nitratireducens]MBL6961129.1 M28 family peptidase [Anaerolineales bacterium]